MFKPKTLAALLGVTFLSVQCANQLSATDYHNPVPVAQEGQQLNEDLINENERLKRELEQLKMQLASNNQHEANQHHATPKHHPVDQHGVNPHSEGLMHSPMRRIVGPGEEAAIVPPPAPAHHGEALHHAGMHGETAPQALHDQGHPSSLKDLLAQFKSADAAEVKKLDGKKFCKDAMCQSRYDAAKGFLKSNAFIKNILTEMRATFPDSHSFFPYVKESMPFTTNASVSGKVIRIKVVNDPLFADLYDSFSEDLQKISYTISKKPSGTASLNNELRLGKLMKVNSTPQKLELMYTTSTTNTGNTTLKVMVEVS